jgi:hypothetical protein
VELLCEHGASCSQKHKSKKYFPSRTTWNDLGSSNKKPIPPSSRRLEPEKAEHLYPGKVKCKRPLEINKYNEFSRVGVTKYCK